LLRQQDFAFFAGAMLSLTICINPLFGIPALFLAGELNSTNWLLLLLLLGLFLLLVLIAEILQVFELQMLRA